MSGKQTTQKDIVEAARTNDAFRREVMTGDHEQVVVMAIPEGGEIGEEVHPATDQLLLFVEAGRAASAERRFRSGRAISSSFGPVPAITSSTREAVRCA